MFLQKIPSQAFAFALCAIATLQPQAHAAETGTITVHVDKPGIKISPTLYGIFFEEISHSGDGGIYAELIQNRSFEEPLLPEGCTLEDGKVVAPIAPSYPDDKPHHWKSKIGFPTATPAWSLEAPSDGAKMSVETKDPLYPRNVNFLRLKISLPTARLLNEGYWGIGVKQGEYYTCSFYARMVDGQGGSVRVGLIGADGRELGEAVVDGVASKGWKKYTTRLAASGSDPKARFFLQPLSAGTIDLDVVSLFPEKTFKNRPNGCRADLGQMLADMKPAFLRFPGGCVVEGLTMENRYQWKNTIGDVAERPGHWSLWGYRNTDGMGFHEFLQLCEDIDAKGMFVINCGLACNFRNGDFWSPDKANVLLQDALDAIEYALGPVTSKWGALRAKAGHPQPFPLKYIEIGNENFGLRYAAQFSQFASAIKKAWPQITCIANQHVLSQQIPGAEMYDQHFYENPQWFFENFHRYDQALRKTASGVPAPRIYVGEFATNKEVGSGNLLAALSDSVFMMGMERNSDLVTMCSYSPLFCNINRSNWPTFMIGYDSAGCFGRTSYYVKKMFATNLPDVSLHCEAVSSVNLPAAMRGGLVGVGTWNSQAEYKDFKVVASTGEMLFENNLSLPEGGFKKVSGDWHIVDGALRQTSDVEGAQVLVGDPNWREYTISLKARKISGAEGFLILFNANERGKGNCLWNVGGFGNKSHGLKAADFEVPRVPGTIETGRWYDVRVEVSPERIRCFLDGQLIHDAEMNRLPSLYAIAGKRNAPGEVILKVVNAAAQDQQVKIVLKGVKSLAAQGQLVTLSNPDRASENSVASPEMIVPVEKLLDNVSGEFTQTFPANSINVLRVRSN